MCDTGDRRREELRRQIRDAFPPQPRNALKLKNFRTHESPDFLFDEHGFLRDWADIEPIQYRYQAAILFDVLFKPSLAPLLLGGFLNAIVTMSPEDADILPEYFVSFLGGKSEHNATRQFLSSLPEGQLKAVTATFEFVEAQWRKWDEIVSRTQRRARDRLIKAAETVSARSDV